VRRRCEAYRGDVHDRIRHGHTATAVPDLRIAALGNGIRSRRATRVTAAETTTYVLIAAAACSSGAGASGATSAASPASASASAAIPAASVSPQPADVKGCTDLSGNWDLASAQSSVPDTAEFDQDEDKLPYTDLLGPEYHALRRQT
jgi:hypothetical protein